MIQSSPHFAKLNNGNNSHNVHDNNSQCLLKIDL